MMMPREEHEQGDDHAAAALLVADLYGYTRMMSTDEQGTIERLRRALDLFRKLIADYSGRLVDTAGDGVFAIFQSVDDAVRFAIEIQKDFRHDQIWHAAGEPLCFRIGVHHGSVHFRGKDVHGLHVNIAARVQSRALPGGICISEQAKQQLSATVPVRVRSIGWPQLKNVREPIELFAIDTELVMTTVTPEPQRGDITTPGEHSQYDLSLAVLPFVNHSVNAADLHLCDGIAAELIANLTCFREMEVIARHSSFLFRSPSLEPDDIGRRLGARYLVTGAVQRALNRIRIRIQLIEAESGRAIWAEHYQGVMAELFSFIDDVTSTVASRVAVQVHNAERQRLESHYIPGLETYGLILRAQDLSFRYRREANNHAFRLFEQAVELDPRYGRSYAGMSRTYNFAWRYRWHDDPDACLERALELARSAIDKDELDARAYGELGYAQLYRKQLDASIAAYERAVELNPHDADILAEYADALVYHGQPELSLQLFGKAMKLNPFYPDWYLWNMADAYNAMSKPEKVIETIGKMRDPSEGSRLLAASHAHLGDLDTARRHADEVLRSHPQFSIGMWARRPPYRDPLVLQRYIEGLRRAGLPE